MWKKIEEKEDLSLEEKLKLWEQGINELERIEEANVLAAEEDKRQQLMNYIVKNSKTKKHSLKGLSTQELERRARLTSERLAAETEKKLKKTQIIDELAANDYGTKAQLSKWKEMDVMDTYKRFKDLQKTNPEKFKLSVVPQTTAPAKRTTSKPVIKKPEVKEQTHFRMALLEKDTIVEDEFMIEEKPLLTQFRDPATFAYQLTHLIQEKTHAKVITESHIPIPSETPGTVQVEKRKRSNLVITELEDQSQPGQKRNQEKGIVPCTTDFIRSKLRITKWTFDKKTKSVVLTKEDGSSKVLKERMI